MTASLTPKQKRVLEFITEFTEREGYRPSQMEIAQGLGFSSLGTVQNYLVRLEKGGFLTRTPHARRGVEIPQAAPAFVSLPLLGKVAAGRPIESSNLHQTVDVPHSLVKAGKEHFVLRVSGQSMIEDGILDGDLVVVRAQKTAHNGETIVALVDHAATIKRYVQTEHEIELHPANPAFRTLRIARAEIESGNTDFKIAGVFAGLIRIA